MRKAFRTALKALFEGDVGTGDVYDPEPGSLVALFAPVVSFAHYRPTRRRVVLPEIVFWDYSARGDSIVPLWDKNVQIDVFTHSDLDEAEDISQRVQHLLDHVGVEMPGAGPGQEEGLTAFMQLQSERDDVVEDADMARKTMIFRALVYDYVDIGAPAGEEPYPEQ
jgi:hypothetical protein